LLSGKRAINAKPDMMQNYWRGRALLAKYAGPDKARCFLLLVGMLAIVWLVPVAEGQEAKTPAASPPDFTALSLEELMNYPVTSVAGHAEKKSETAAAVHIITQEDIRRSGATSIPEALRMAPGLDVARVDAHTWAISSRGFNDVFANKLLVLQKGQRIRRDGWSRVERGQRSAALRVLDTGSN
jgi:iron complex outermembrane receptor protein